MPGTFDMIPPPRRTFFDMNWGQFVTAAMWIGGIFAVVGSLVLVAMGVLGTIGFGLTVADSGGGSTQITLGANTTVNSGGTGVSLVASAGNNVIIRSLVMDSAGSLTNVGDTTHINIPYVSSRGTGVQLAVNSTNTIRSLTCTGICSPATDGNTVTLSVPNPTVTSAGSANSLVFNSAARQIVSLMFGPGMSFSYIDGGQTLLMDSTPFNATISVKNQGGGVPLMIVESIAPTIRTLVGEGSVSVFNVGNETHISGMNTSVTSTSGGTSLVFNSAQRQLVSLIFGPSMTTSFVNGGQNLMIDVNVNASLSVVDTVPPALNQVGLSAGGNKVKIISGSNTATVSSTADIITIQSSEYNYFVNPTVFSVSGTVSSAVGGLSFFDVSNFYNNFERGLLTYQFTVMFLAPSQFGGSLQIATPLPGPPKLNLVGRGPAACQVPSISVIVNGQAILKYDGVNYYVEIFFYTDFEYSGGNYPCYAQIQYLTTN